MYIETGRLQHRGNRCRPMSPTLLVPPACSISVKAYSSALRRRNRPRGDDRFPVQRTSWVKAAPVSGRQSREKKPGTGRADLVQQAAGSSPPIFAMTVSREAFQTNGCLSSVPGLPAPAS